MKPSTYHKQEISLKENAFPASHVERLSLNDDKDREEGRSSEKPQGEHWCGCHWSNNIFRRNEVKPAAAPQKLH